MKGTRVQSIIRELRGEKIDIVEWSEDPILFVTNAISPAKVQHVSIVDDAEKVMEVVVEDKQLSLAIGKKGQNVRLAAKLTGWKIDIKSEEEKRRDVEAQLGALEIGESGDGALQADGSEAPAADGETPDADGGADAQAAGEALEAGFPEADAAGASGEAEAVEAEAVELEAEAAGPGGDAAAAATDAGDADVDAGAEAGADAAAPAAGGENETETAAERPQGSAAVAADDETTEKL
jgi:N utilization substance protein A